MRPILSIALLIGLVTLTGCVPEAEPTDAEVAASVANRIEDLPGVRSVEVTPPVDPASSLSHVVEVDVEADISDDQIRAIADEVEALAHSTGVRVDVTDGDARWSQYAGGGNDVTEPLLWLRADDRFSAIDVDALSADGAVDARELADAAADFHAAMTAIDVATRLLVEDSDDGVGEYRHGFEVYVHSGKPFPAEAVTAVAAFDEAFPAGDSFVELLEGDYGLDVRASAGRDEDLAAALTAAADVALSAADGEFSVKLGPVFGSLDDVTPARMPLILAAAAIPELVSLGFGTERSTAQGEGGPDAWVRVNDLIAAELEVAATIWRTGDVIFRSPALDLSDPLRGVIPALAGEGVVEEMDFRLVTQRAGARELTVRIDDRASAEDLAGMMALLAEAGLAETEVVIVVDGDDRDTPVATIIGGVLTLTGQESAELEAAVEDAWQAAA
jgi:hypothetical protein